MTPIRFFTDEDIYGQVAPQLRANGIDAISTPEAGRLGETDESHLVWASAEGRVVVSFNIKDFAPLHYEWIGKGDHHAGIVVSQRRPIGDLIRRLLNLGRTIVAEDMRNRLEYLSQWPAS